MQTLHSKVETQEMCMFNRDHISPTLAFDADYTFTPQELSLQRVFKAAFKDGLSFTTPLQSTNCAIATLAFWCFYPHRNEPYLRSLFGFQDSEKLGGIISGFAVSKVHFGNKDVYEV